MDETRIDAAPTPAHVFAYRAFRSVFVASPESSPIRPQPILYDNKENTYTSNLQYKKTSNSPSHTKRKSPGKDLLSLTPKRQKTIPISPTKSILKNPKALTPRRPDLRDLSVTFKDIRKSASPDLAQRLTTLSMIQPSRLSVATKPIIQTKTKEEIFQSGNSMSVEAAHHHPIEAIEQEHAALVANIVRNPAFDVNDYVVKTEKELRRFAAYGKKWKKHAQKQDQEIERLQALLKDTQEENEQLRRKLVRGDGERNCMDSARIATWENVVETSMKESFMSAKEMKAAKSSKGNETRPESASKAPRLDTSIASAVVNRAISPALEQARTNGEPHLQQPEHSRRTSSMVNGDSATKYNAQRIHLKVRDTKSPLVQQAPAILDKPRDVTSELPVRPAGVTTGPSSATLSTSLTLDRQTAARERLRQKAEGRKASMRLNAAPTTSTTTDKPRQSPAASVPTVDESELDWADLGQ